MLLPVDIDRQILAIANALEGETERYAQVAELAATCEADYKVKAARVWVTTAAAGKGMTAGERQARADIAAGDELRAWKIAEARRAATKEALLSMRARLDALRTLAANVRHQI